MYFQFRRLRNEPKQTSGGLCPAVNYNRRKQSFGGYVREQVEKFYGFILCQLMVSRRFV